MTTIERLDPRDAATAAAWDSFVLGCPQATFFHRAGWQRILREVFRHDTHYLLARNGGRITGVLPLAHVKSWLFGSALSSLPFAVYGGVAAEDFGGVERVALVLMLRMFVFDEIVMGTRSL